MLAGTVAAALLLARFTSIPPTPAGAARVTIPVALCPALTMVGLTANPDNVAVEGPTGLMVNAADVEFTDIAVISTDVELETDEVETLNVPLD